MSEDYRSPYTIHPGGSKMYWDVKGYCEVCGAVLNLPTSDARASEASKDTEAIANTEVEVGQDCYGLYFGVTQGTHRRRFHLGGH
jgi:hypothetical protein